MTKEILQAFITKMFDEGFSRNTISPIRGILSKAFDYAVTWEDIDFDKKLLQYKQNSKQEYQ